MIFKRIKSKNWFMLTLSVIAVGVTGCGNSNVVVKETNVVTETDTKHDEEIVIQDDIEETTNNDESDVTHIDNINNIDLLTIIGRDWGEVQAEIGEPYGVDDGPYGDVFLYDTFTVMINDNYEVEDIGITTDEIDVLGIKIGMKPSEIRNILGKANQEINDNGFAMEYRTTDNNTSIVFYATDFMTPIHYIDIVDRTSGQEVYMELSPEEINQLMVGKWIEESVLDANDLASLALTISEDTIRDPFFKFKYEVLDSHSFKMGKMDFYDNVERYDTYFIEFFDNGDRFEKYQLDSNGNVCNKKVYYRYS